MNKLRGMVLLLAICFILSACQYGPGLDHLQMQQFNGAGNTDEYTEDYDILDKGPVSGGVLNLFTTEPDTFNPVLTKNAYVSDFLNLIFEGLTELNEKQQAAPKLSDSWSVSADGLIWNFHIRDSIKWQDGQPFTASDAEFTVQLLMNAAVDSVYKPLVRNIATCAAVDSSNFKLVLVKPNSFVPEMMTFPILPKHQFNQTDALSASTSFKPVGTGPYRFEAYVEKKQVLLKADKSWWYLGVDKNSENGMYIDTVNINVFKNTDDAMGALQTGGIDVMAIDSGDFSKYKGRRDLTIKKYTSREFEMLAFNLNNPVMSDNYARKAISLAIDRDKLITAILPGDAQAAELPILPDSWISDLEGVSADPTVLDTLTAVVSPAGITQESTDNTGEAVNKTGKVDAASTNAAVSLNKSAALVTNASITAKTPQEALLLGGWKESKQGYYKVIGGIRRYLKVELLVNSNNSIRVKTAQMICSQLNLAGITAVCTQEDWNGLLARTNTGKFDLVFIGCRIPQIPDISYLYSSSYLPVTLPVSYANARNISGYFNIQLDAYINALFKENNPESKKVLYKAALEKISRDTPYIGLYFTRDAMVYGKNLRGSLAPDTWNRYNDIIHWYKPQQH
jgi:peptide/nickel transport system substrate-binding protein